MDLESDTPPESTEDQLRAEVAAVENAALTGTPLAPPPVDPDDSQAVEVQGGKYVPLSALKLSRAELQETKAKLADTDLLRQHVARLEGTLSTYQQVQQQLTQAQQPQAPVSPTADPELVELARSLDYYKPDGSPDLARATTFNALLERKAESKARQMVEPLQAQAAQEQSNRNYQLAAQEKTPAGMPIDQALLNTLWRGLPAHLTADPRVARIIASTVLGEQARHTPVQPAAPVHPPLVTESIAGPVPQRRVAISDAEKKVIDHRGMSEEAYAKATKDFRSGRLNPLED